MTVKTRRLHRVRDKIRLKHNSIRAEQAYLDWIKRFTLCHGKRHPLEMGKPEVQRLLTTLAVTRNVSASTQNQALSALLFLYKDILDRELERLVNLVRAKRPARLPVVLTQATREKARALHQQQYQREAFGAFKASGAPAWTDVKPWPRRKSAAPASDRANPPEPPQ